MERAAECGIVSYDLLAEHLCETFSIVWAEDDSSIKTFLFLTKHPSSQLSSSKDFNHNVPSGEALTVTLRSPRVPAGGSLLEPEKPARVAAEGANPFRKERRDRSEVMLIRPQQVHESTKNSKPRH